MNHTELFSQLEFQFPFRKYQSIILDQMAENPDDKRYHIVAPPGSGKTIVGIELIKRLGQPAVVFTPTTTIQMQWREKVAMFFPKGSKIDLNEAVSIKSSSLKPINVFTYQLISTPGESLEFVNSIAEQSWINDLLISGIVVTPEEALERITTIKHNNPRLYKKELSKYYKRVKTQLLKDPTQDRTQFLHKNAVKLINRLVEYGIKTIVMDEVHHLLDYWAIVITELLSRIEDVTVIGLTATPPLSATSTEMNNYLSIVDTIDYEIPTPAVVKEGNLAPYQDLVYFCKPTRAEKRYIKKLQDDFLALVSGMGEQDSFRKWVTDRIIKRELSDGRKQTWTNFFNAHPLIAIAGVKFITQVIGEKVPHDVIIIEEMDKKMELDDWVQLLTDYALNKLKLSKEKIDQEEYTRIRVVLKAFGFVLTEKGLRHHRSPSDLLLSLSEAKHTAVIKILKTEISAMKDNLRAVVITDFEKQSATTKKYLEGVLDSDSGSAARVFREIAQHKKTTLLEPILVTGKTVLIDRDHLPEIKKAMEIWRSKSGLTFTFETVPTEYEKIVELTGSGPDWKSNTYVRMVTDLFEKGIIKCIVGTRGVLGEGWDSLTLNTLIDLTSATTSVTVNQIRGRSIRLDPEWEHKLSNNWDVVCVAPSFAKGKQDFDRFVKKHQTFYGLGSKGKIIKGVMHVDEMMILKLYTTGFHSISFALLNSQMLARARDRASAYKEWRIGEEYQNFEYSVTKLDPTDIKFKTAYTLRDSLKAIFHRISLALTEAFIWYILIFGEQFNKALHNKTMFAFLITGLLAVLLLVTIKDVSTYIKRAFVELPIDSFLLDIATALVLSLREAKLISPELSADNVRVTEDASMNYDIYLDYANTEDSKTFSTALRELMAPVLNQRYLISRSEDNISLGFYQPLWWSLRKLFRIVSQEKVAYHPVPTVLATKKKLAKIFAHYWKMYVGGGELIYTKSTKGRKTLLQLRRSNHHKIKRLTYDVWR